MTTPDVAALQTIITELKIELARARTQGEVFRGFYERQAAELDQLFRLPDTPEPTLPRRHLRLVVDRGDAANAS